MKTTRHLLSIAALALLAACGTKGPLVLADEPAAKAGTSEATGHGEVAAKKKADAAADPAADVAAPDVEPVEEPDEAADDE